MGFQKILSCAYRMNSILFLTALVALAGSFCFAEAYPLRADVGCRPSCLQEARDLQGLSSGLQEMGDSLSCSACFHGQLPWSAGSHQVTAIGAFGELLSIEDGTTFAVRSSDQYRVAYWPEGSWIRVLPSNGYFFGLVSSGYDVRLFNELTGETVEAVLSLGPFLFNAPARWIIGVDDHQGIIYLSDGNAMLVDSSDCYLLRNWDENDHVIVGFNDGWHHNSYPNILLNVATVNHLRVRLLY